MLHVQVVCNAAGQGPLKIVEIYVEIRIVKLLYGLSLVLLILKFSKNDCLRKLAGSRSIYFFKAFLKRTPTILFRNYQIIRQAYKFDLNYPNLASLLYIVSTNFKIYICIHFFVSSWQKYVILLG